MKILGLISSPLDPASRVRILQYGPYLEKEGELLYCKYFKPLREADPAAWSLHLKKITGINEWRSADFAKTIGRIPLLFNQTGYDLIWQNRLLQLHHSFWEKRLKKPVIFDFDDAIWINEGEKQVKSKVERSQMIFAGNEFLADFARAYNSNVQVVPTTVDTENLFPVKSAQDTFTIGWIGTKSNFQYLEMIKNVLLDFLSTDKSARLMIVSSELPGFLRGRNEQIVFKHWSAEKENELINEFSVGIMPLADSTWTRGKCGYKLLQYLACGKPIIASPVGINARIMKEADIGITASAPGEWLSALKEIKNETSLSMLRGANGRTLVLEKYSCAAWAKTIVRYMKMIT